MNCAHCQMATLRRQYELLITTQRRNISIFTNHQTHMQTQIENKPGVLSMTNTNGLQTVLRANNSYLDARIDKPIIQSFTNYDELKLTLLGISKMLGITNAPDEPMLDSIVVFLVAKYFDFTIDEIRHAFILYASGDLGDEIKKENSTFNIVFIGSVLGKYRIVRKSHWDKYQQQVDEQKRIQENALISDEDKARNAWKQYLNAVRVHKRFDFPMTDWNRVFQYLDMNGFIEMTADERMEYKIDVKVSNLQKLNEALANEMDIARRAVIKEDIARFNNESYLKYICRKNIVLDYMQKNIQL